MCLGRRTGTTKGSARRSGRVRNALGGWRRKGSPWSVAKPPASLAPHPSPCSRPHPQAASSPPPLHPHVLEGTSKPKSVWPPQCSGQTLTSSELCTRPSELRPSFRIQERPFHSPRTPTRRLLALPPSTPSLASTHPTWETSSYTPSLRGLPGGYCPPPRPYVFSPQLLTLELAAGNYGCPRLSPDP